MMRNKNMRVCMISESFLPTIGGLQFQVKYLTEALAERGIEVFLLSHDDGERFLNKNAYGFPKFIKLKHRNLVLGCIELHKLIKRISPHLIHVHSAEKNAFQLALLKSFKLISQPFIITSHGADIMIYKEIRYGTRLSPISACKVKFTLQKCAKHVIVGKSMEKFALEAGSKPDKIVEINNGVPSTNKKIPKEKQIAILTKYGIASNEHILLSLSGMRLLKGIEYLVKAMPKILTYIPTARLVLTCKGGRYEEYVREIVKSLRLEQYVKFIGFVTNEEEKINLIRACDVFCKPSLLEACSVAILEVMREGKAVIASIPAGIDIITHGRNGLLTRPKDPDDFANAVIKVLKNQNLKEKIENYAKKDIRNFDIRKIAKQYISLYEEICKSNVKL